MLEHALLGDVQGRPGDSGDLVLVDATPGVLALCVQYHEDGGPDERPPSIEVFCQFLALLRLEVVSVAHLDDTKETREDVGADASDERATAPVLVMDGGRPRLGSESPACWEQERFSCPDPELIEAGAGAVGMLHGFARIGHGVSAVRTTEGAVSLSREGWTLLRADPVSEPPIGVHSLPEEATLLGGEQTRADG